MFVTNKRVKLPKEIVVGSKGVNDKCEETKVSDEVRHTNRDYIICTIC